MNSEAVQKSDQERSGLRLFDLLASAGQHVDNASCTLFRIVFGSFMAKWAWDYLTLGRVTQFYVEPVFHFTYYGLDWLKPWPGNGMYIHFCAMLLLGLAVAAGFLYRISSVLLALGMTYVFLLDRTNYQNHYYLLSLIACWLPFLPLHHNVSVDAWLWPRLRIQSIPRWCLWCLQFHIGVPYFFGGLAKLEADWLTGAPLRQMLLTKADLPFIGTWLAGDSSAMLLAWMGLLFDLLVVPALLCRRTRLLAFCACAVFHVMNSIVFDIHVFPWFMLVGTTIFFRPDWPRRALGGSPINIAVPEPASGRRNLLVERIGTAMIVGYVLFQVAWPFRHQLYEGDASWNERGHHFAWRMMLRGKTVVLGYAVKDLADGRVVDGNVSRFINPEQSEKFGRDPEMILHFAQFIGSQYRSDTGHDCEVYALAMVSLNGRKPQLMIDPNVDLLKEKRGFGPRPWVLSMQEPLRKEPWDLPIAQWREHVDIPELQFLSPPVVPHTTSSGLAAPTETSPRRL